MANLQYIGARYVPKFFLNPDDQSNDWKAGVDYEALTIVTYNNDSYTSRKPVPDTVGNPASNPDYWACTTKYTAALMALQTTVQNLEDFVNPAIPLDTTAQTISEAINELNALKIFKTPQLFGAKADGITDDTDAINTALTGGGFVFFPAGTYIVDGSFDYSDYAVEVNRRGLLVKDDTFIIMDNKAILKQKPTNNECYVIVNIVDVENVHIMGGQIAGERDEHTGTTGEWGYGIHFDANAHDCIVDGLNIYDCWGDGIYLNGKNNIIQNCVINANRRQGITVDRSSHCKILSNLIKNTGVDTAYSLGTAPKAGIDIEPVSGYCTNLTIENNIITDNAGEAIHLYNAGNASNFNKFSICNNTIESGSNITATQTINLIRASEITFSNNKITTTKPILFSECKNVIVNGNNCIGDNTCILYSYGGEDFIITSNDVRADTIYPDSTTSLLQCVGTNNCNVKNNIFNGNGLTGRYLVTMRAESGQELKGAIFNENMVCNFDGVAILLLQNVKDIIISSNNEQNCTLTEFINNQTVTRADVSNNYLADSMALLANYNNLASIFISDNMMVDKMLFSDLDFSNNINIAVGTVERAKLIDKCHADILIKIPAGTTITSNTHIAWCGGAQPYNTYIGQVAYSDIADINVIMAVNTTASNELVVKGNGTLAGDAYIEVQFEILNNADNYASLA